MQIQISHPVLREFFESLAGTDRIQQHKYLTNAEKLQIIVDADKEYPFDFIVYRICSCCCLQRGRNRLPDSSGTG